MPVQYHEEHQIFHLQASDTSYAFQITRWGMLAHLYWGKKVRSDALHRLLELRARSTVSPRPDPLEPAFSPDTMPQEYPSYGSGDYRPPAIEVELENGASITNLRFRAYRIVDGKPPLTGLPATYVESDEEAQTLEIELFDDLIGLTAILSYTVFHNDNAITRSVRLANSGHAPIKLLRALSMSIDLPHHEFDLLHLSGAHLRERAVYRRTLMPGGQGIESRRGVSGHQQNPFISLLTKGTDEDRGEVYAFSLVYSGNFMAHAEVDQFFTTRVSLGIHPFNFGWTLAPGASFQTPEAVLTYTDQGLGGMSRIWHRLYRNRLCRGIYRDQARPILINNWEATYFDFDADKLEQIAKVGSEIGVELFVLDDGWFGKRDWDNSSLGDWTPDPRKLPHGLADLGRRLERLNLKLGLWLEPEMISPDSDLYRLHPDWCLHVPERRRTESRHQLVLDLSRQDVVTYIIETITALLVSAPIAYVKWDLNRNLTEIGSALLGAEYQREVGHRYILGLYQILERITSRFPEVLFESCAGGGGRFDPGMLYYMPQTWTSDNSDAVSRLYIQYGTSLVYPPITMGAHVTSVPNHQTARITPLRTRGHAAMSGNYGLELDLAKLSEDERSELQEQIATYKEIRSIVQFGSFFRLRNPFEYDEAAWMFVTDRQEQAVVFYFQILSEPAGRIRRLRLKGLDPFREYVVSGEHGDASAQQLYGGDHLMNAGLILPALKGDYQSVMYLLQS